MTEARVQQYREKRPERRLQALMRDAERLMVIGNLHWLAIDLSDLNQSQVQKLSEEFDNASRFGYFEGSSIFIGVKNRTFDLRSIMYLLLDIIDDQDHIEGIRGHVVMTVFSEEIDVVLEVDGNKSYPTIIEISDHSKHFDIMNVLLIRWKRSILLTI